MPGAHHGGLVIIPKDKMPLSGMKIEELVIEPPTGTLGGEIRIGINTIYAAA